MKCKHHFLCVLTIALAFASGVVMASPHIVIQPYGAEFDDVSGDVKAYGQMIVHRGFDVQLEEVIKHIPLFSVQYAGLHYAEAEPDNPNHVEARAKGIAERLVIAWALLDKGGELKILDDEWNTWRLNGQKSPSTYPAIYIQSSSIGQNPLRIITLYPEDAQTYPWVSDEKTLARYIKSLIEAHYLLFWKKETDIRKYEALPIDYAREGKIFKEAAIRALEMAKLKKLDKFTDEILKDALARIAMPQRERLYRMATTAPMDWGQSVGQ